jgi:PleD family two-component response regulator
MAVATVRHGRPPVALIVNDQEWSTRSLESILGPNGYAVLRAYTGAKGLERAFAARPDLIIVGASLPDMDALEWCRRVRADPRVSDSTPLIVTTTTRVGRTERLEALRAGAWDYLGHPLDAEELLLRFDAFVRAKHEADHARTEGLIDAPTGLYSVHGLARRARELASHVYRLGGAFACVVFRTETPADEQDLHDAVSRFAGRLRENGRSSDAIGRIGEAEFAVFAPGTDAAGAAQLVQRLLGSELGLLAGYHAVTDFRASKLEPQDMLHRATEALRQAPSPTPALH